MRAPLMPRRLVVHRSQDELTTGAASLNRVLRSATLATCCFFFISTIFVPSQRGLSIPLGNGECIWTPTNHDVPDIDLFKTVLAGFPSGDKRLVYMQYEALTGLPAKDEWAYSHIGQSNHPFIKTNWPHHDGTFDHDSADQVVLVVRNMRSTLIEFHDIMWDLDFADNYPDALEHEFDLYEDTPDTDESFLTWRDYRVMDEVHWFGWFIDYWMEDGLMRDIQSHKTTTLQHWQIFRSPWNATTKERSYPYVVGEKVVVPNTYDEHCKKIKNGCQPVAVISSERLVDPATGPEETRKIAKTIQGKYGIGDFLISEDSWGCIWRELLVKKKGVRTFLDRRGLEKRDYNFSVEMLDHMIEQYDRLLTKYSSDPRPTSKDLVELFTEHRQSLVNESDEVKNGLRTLTERDFLGPKTRLAMKLQKLAEQGVEITDEARALHKDGDVERFMRVEKELFDRRRKREKEAIVKTEKAIQRNRDRKLMIRKRKEFRDSYVETERDRLMEVFRKHH